MTEPDETAGPTSGTTGPTSGTERPTSGSTGPTFGSEIPSPPSGALARVYEPKDIEDRISELWLERGIFAASADDPAEPHCIVIPPPNVTGSLHIGHALVNTLQDVLTRRARMQGRATLWLPGTDHAGIATQLVVERKLAADGRSRRDMTREQFEAEVWKWKEESGSTILMQLRRLGASCDWTRTTFTMDPEYSRAVREAFVRLHGKGLVYRGTYMVNWCPSCGTALSDLESEHEDRDSTLWSIAYPLEDGSGEVVVATTRPETMLGDTAVAVSPADARYASLVGRNVRLPLVDRLIPIVADEHVDAAFGTGAVKVTPAHDPNDHEIGRRHALAVVQVIGHDGRMTQEAGRYAGATREEARKAVLRDLEALGLRRGEKTHRHAVAQCQRCASVVEPLVSTQWFCRMEPLAKPAIAAVNDGRTRIVPDQYRKVYLHWMENIRDWCISRQLWWGHRIPAWHCAACAGITVAVDPPSTCSTCGSDRIAQDEDVLDTWFSSWLWPFATMGWPESTKDLAKYYPTTVLVTAFDILFFWVARMMMAGLEFMGDVPFREVFIHGLVRDEHGEKMSKVKGNVIDPLDVIDKAGADALRFTLAITCVPARDIPWNPRRMEGYRTFANKLWQAARFVEMNLAGVTDRTLDPEKLALQDHWILTRLHQTASTVNAALDEYRFHEAADALYHFVWDEFCAWYIEMAKPSLMATEGPLAAEADARRRVLLAVLDDSLRLLHPFMPFITEELWQSLPHEGVTITTARYPIGTLSAIDATALERMAVLQGAVTAIRNLRAESGIDPKRTIAVKLAASGEETRDLLSRHGHLIAALARTQAPEIGESFERRGSLTSEAGAVSVLIPLDGLVDPVAERERLSQQAAKARKEQGDLAARLGNADFVARAKPEVVATARARSDELSEKLARIERTLEALADA